MNQNKHISEVGKPVVFESKPKDQEADQRRKYLQYPGKVIMGLYGRPDQCDKE